MLVNKPELIALFEQELEAWETLLAGLSPAQITEAWPPDGLSIKDTVAHLGAWQQRTCALIEAALHGHEPRYPEWPIELGEDETSDAVDAANAWILETNRSRPWSYVHREWRDGFIRFLELIRAIPESDLLPEGKLAWLADFQPSELLPGSYDHHHSEHRGLLEAWMRERLAAGDSVRAGDSGDGA
jgi:hypothetical protein